MSTWTNCVLDMEAPDPDDHCLACANTRPEGYTVEYIQTNFFPHYTVFSVLSVRPPNPEFFNSGGCHWVVQFRILKNIGITSTNRLKTILNALKPLNTHIGYLVKYKNEQDQGIWTVEYVINGRCVNHPFRVIDASVPIEAHTELKKESKGIKIEN